MTLFVTTTITVETLNPRPEAMPVADPIEITCFKAYDIRGRIPDELNEDIAYRIGRAFAKFLTVPARESLM